nr:PREDICTED: uncharacterized protein LOC107982246 [Anolis carolinensis]|eukprot:XP_016846595.1 PREDICTED: uncharacterized protein LOC107982246 [Anolis carolinensis]
MPTLLREDLGTADGLAPTSQPGHSTSEQAGLSPPLQDLQGDHGPSGAPGRDLRGNAITHTNITVEFLTLAGWLGPLLYKEDRALAKRHLTARCLLLFHHEAAKIRKAALECFQHFLWHPVHPLEERQTINGLLAVLMHVEDEDEEVTKTARETLKEAAEVLRWHLKDSVLAEDTFSLQELLHKISKCLIHHCSPRREVEEQVYGCLRFFKSQRPSAKKVVAMLLSHVLHKNYNMCTDRNIYTFEAWLMNLLADHDPEVR